MTNDPNTSLTQNQLELVAMVASGYDYKRIADAKFLHPNSVRKALDRAKMATGTESLSHLCTLSFESGAIKRSENGYVPVVDPTVVA